MPTVSRLSDDTKVRCTDTKVDHEEKMREQKKLVFGLKEELAGLKMSTAVEVSFSPSILISQACLHACAQSISQS